MRERHGIPDAQKIAVSTDGLQSVHVTDGCDDVRLSLGACSFPAGLTPEQAEWLAKQLIASAKRVREANAA